jgi:PAS domain S-box-containing protein
LPFGASILYLPLLLFLARSGSGKLVWAYFAVAALLMLAAPLLVPRWPMLQPVHFLINRLIFLTICAAISWFAIRNRQASANSEQSSESLQRREQEFRDLAENLPDVVTRFDRQLRHIYVNRAILRYTGKAPEVFLDKTHVDLNMPPDLVELWQGKIREVLDSGEAQTIEYAYSATNGIRHFECRLIPEKSADGSVETVLGINRDVTESIQAQSQAEAHLAQLAHVSRLSTIGSLVSEIAHEVNQPLHAISSYAQASLNLINGTSKDRTPNLADWLRQIADQAHRAAEIVRRSNRFVRNSPANRQVLDVNELIRDCLRLENFDLRQNSVKLRCELLPAISDVHADAIQVQQVLVNLIRNAIEAMADTPAEERHLLVQSKDADTSVQISIRDSGVGITKEQSDKLFEPFFTTKEEGLGMGLAVSQAIAESHSGQLWAEPNADRGVTFFLTLPVYRKEESHEFCRI